MAYSWHTNVFFWYMRQQNVGLDDMYAGLGFSRMLIHSNRNCFNSYRWGLTLALFEAKQWFRVCPISQSLQELSNRYLQRQLLKNFPVAASPIGQKHPPKKQNQESDSPFPGKSHLNRGFLVRIRGRLSAVPLFLPELSFSFVPSFEERLFLCQCKVPCCIELHCR